VESIGDCFSAWALAKLVVAAFEETQAIIVSLSDSGGLVMGQWWHQIAINAGGVGIALALADAF
jgi:hypothetical protein